MFSKFTWCKVVAGGWSLHMSMSKSQRKLGIPLQRDSGHLDTATVATCVHWKSGKNLCVWKWWWWWIYRTPVWQLSKLAGLLSQHRHHYKQQAPGGEIEQITTFTTAFDVIISSRIVTVSPDRGTPQWANCKNRGLSYNPHKPPQGQPIHFDFYLHLITTVIDIFNAPKKLLDVETFNLDQVDYLRMALLKGIVSDLYAFQLSHFSEQLRTNREVDISF